MHTTGNGWRAAFALAAVTLAIGGAMHPGGSMAMMLEHPDWLASHSLQFVAYAAMAAGLWLFGNGSLPPMTSPWLRLALIGTIVQAIEMLFHTAAMVDHARLVAGAATPILTAHLALAVIAHPIFGITVSGFILNAARERVLGTIWLAPVGIIGALAHGAAAPLVVLFELEQARILFPMVVLLSLWMVIVAAMPRRSRAA